MLVEFQVLIPIRTEPVSTVIVPFIGEAHSDAIVAPTSEFLYEPIV